ncbi:venom carboxylesterase-6-like isoform X2 [Zophobas morio]|uniref:venom carboxylesterase-6-like isoform X2 n=1 Tax=Zophobas morio TaxID=2755281 RepID=UPI003082FF48
MVSHMAPQPIDKWDGTWDATHLQECAQIHTIYGKSTMSGNEDCLYVNVYVPRILINVTDNLDVIVHIHGGGFSTLSGHNYAHPGYLMDHDVIFVTFNYRIGILGFLSTEDDAIPGNNGFKDQVLALKWVQENIYSFGGNPGSVTLTGASAGGASVHLHYLSPMSVGLFHRGFSQSGSALNSWVVQAEASNKAKTVALAVGCPEAPTHKLKECLKQRPYQQILSKMSLFCGYKNHAPVPFNLVLEKGSNSFLSEHPYGLLVTGQVQDLPWLVSFVEHEGYFIVDGFRDRIETMNQKWEQVAPFMIYYNYTVAKNHWGDVARQIKDFYLGKNEKFAGSNFDNLVRLAGEGVMIHGVVKSVLVQAAVTNASVYLFHLSYTGDKNIISHGDDNQYFYYGENEKALTKNQLKMKDIFIDMLVTYAKTGTPSINGTVWEPAKDDHLNFLKISSPEKRHIHMETNNDLGNQNFWDSLESSEKN